MNGFTFSQLRNLIFPYEMGKSYYDPKVDSVISIGYETIPFKRKLQFHIQEFCKLDNILNEETERLLYKTIPKNEQEAIDFLIGIYEVNQNDTYETTISKFCTKKGYEEEVINEIINVIYKDNLKWKLDIPMSSLWSSFGFNKDGFFNKSNDLKSINTYCKSCLHDKANLYHPESNHRFCSSDCAKYYINNKNSFF